MYVIKENIVFLKNFRYKSGLIWRGVCIQNQNVFWVYAGVGFTSSRMDDPTRVFSDKFLPLMCSDQPYHVQ